MPTSLPDHQCHLELARRLSTTVVSDPSRHPIIVYRGEHGTSSDPVHSRTRAISFGTALAASSYAINPNNPQDVPAAPRVMAAYLSIANPVIDNRDDPFIEMGTVLEKLGRDKAERIARRFAHHIENTGNWVDGFAHDFESVEQLLDLEPGRLRDLYLDAYPVFDDDEVVGWFADAGYDGAIHLGNGETALEEEFKVSIGRRSTSRSESTMTLSPRPSRPYVPRGWNKPLLSRTAPAPTTRHPERTYT